MDDNFITLTEIFDFASECVDDEHQERLGSATRKLEDLRGGLRSDYRPTPIE